MLTFGLLGPLGPFLDLFGDGLDVVRGFFGGRGAAKIGSASTKPTRAPASPKNLPSARSTMSPGRGTNAARLAAGLGSMKASARQTTARR